MAFKAGREVVVRTQMGDVLKRLELFIAELKGVTAEAVKEALQPIYDTSQVYVPVQTGRLKNSGYLEVERQGNIIQAEVGYGKGGEPPYTLFVHENIDAYHEPPTQSKFLEHAVDENINDIREKLFQKFRHTFTF